MDYSYFGLILFRVYFKGAYISEKDKQNIVTILKKNPLVTSIYALSGGFDLVIEFTAPNPSRFNKELKKIGAEIPTLNNYQIILNVVSHLYPRSYLLKNKQEHEEETIIGGDRTLRVFNEQEKKIIQQLLLNTQIRYTQLAEQADLNIKTVIQNIKRLKNEKIIRGFQYLIKGTNAKIDQFRLFLKLHNISAEREKQLLAYLLTTKEVISLNKTVGDWDLEIDIESRDAMAIRKEISQLREEFKDLIQSFNLIEISEYYKKSYLPEFLFT